MAEVKELEVENTLTSLGKNIRKLRRAEEMTEQDLADQVGCSRATICSIEKGLTPVGSPSNVRLPLIVKICKLLGISSIKIES